MSWHFSQALVEAYSEANSSDGRPSAPLSGKPTPQAYLSPDRMRAFSRLSRFGMTCEPLTDDLGAAVLTWCLAASPAKTSAQPEKAPESTESAAECGRTWRESFARWDRDSSSWRTPQCSLLAGLDVFSETWPQWGMMRAGECSVQTMPALRTSETGFGLWPTPTLCGNYNRKGASSTSGDGLATAVRMWPTPRTPSGGADNSANKTRPSGHKGTTNLLGAVKMWPTPCATDHKGSGKAGTLRDRLDYATERGATKSNTYATPQARDLRSGSTDRWDDPDRSRNLNDQVGGQLNPTWVEKLMGWPKNWTSLHPMIDSDYVSWIMGFCEHEKIRTNHTLQMLRRTPYAQNFQRTTGRSFGIQEAQVLLSELRQHPEGFDEAWIQLASEEAPEAEVRSVRPSASFASAPSGSADNKQPPREHSDAMQKLPRLLAHDGKEAWADSRWENAIPRTAVAVPARVDRLKAIGNGQVPSVAALAWRILSK